MIEVGLGFVIGIVILITLAFVGAHILENSKYEAAQIKKKAETDAENLLYRVKKDAKQKAEEDAAWIVNEGKETALIIVNKAKEEAEFIRSLAEGERSAVKEEIRKEHEEAEKRIESLAAKSLEKENLLINVSVEEDARKKASEEAEKIIEEAMLEAYEIRKKADSILKESESKADFLLKDTIQSVDSARRKAREEAETVKSEAKAKAKEILSSALSTQETADRMLDEAYERNNREMDELLDFLRGLKGPKFIQDDSELKQALSIKKTDLKTHKLFTDVELYTNWNYDGHIDFQIYHLRHLINVAIAYCDFLIDRMLEDVYKNGLEVSKKKIAEIVFSVEKMIPGVFRYKISNEYVERKVKQATILYEIEEYKARKKEEQRVLREQQKEEVRAQREFEREMKKAREDEVKALAALAKAKAEAEKEKEDKAKFARLQEKIAGLEEALQEAIKRGERAQSMAQLTRHGTVYVISNIGSFGEGVYKIGLTRRLEPLERVHELGDASVPFPFDVHALIESDDAPALETALHQAFADKKLNIINGRKEFFRVSLDEVKEKVKELGYETEWVDVPVAPQFRDSEYFRKK